MTGITRRIEKETERLLKTPPEGTNVTVDTDNLRLLYVKIKGPKGSPYEGGIYLLHIFIPVEYPMMPPKIQMITKIYHPCVDQVGRVCIRELYNNWSPALQIRHIIVSIQLLMSDQCSDNPLDVFIGKHWGNDEAGAIRTAREWCFMYAFNYYDDIDD
ncbi:hypothetical protein SteCoe_5250 [Stentor coeruleus]|uniref:UBC core domain-containing protein n=1 Tax=Stentor coeruleus TaxID=5963 RepID=A0A1R2CSU4_9CILI|nr:hypothetical protein SteCoe_5250 [Stentor coeruleus]